MRVGGVVASLRDEADVGAKDADDGREGVAGAVQCERQKEGGHEAAQRCPSQSSAQGQGSGEAQGGAEALGVT